VYKRAKLNQLKHHKLLSIPEVPYLRMAKNFRIKFCRRQKEVIT